MLNELVVGFRICRSLSMSAKQIQPNGGNVKGCAPPDPGGVNPAILDDPGEPPLAVPPSVSSPPHSSFWPSSRRPRRGGAAEPPLSAPRRRPPPGSPPRAQGSPAGSPSFASTPLLALRTPVGLACGFLFWVVVHRGCHLDDRILMLPDRDCLVMVSSSRPALAAWTRWARITTPVTAAGKAATGAGST
jgi:hypothetical protein